jgi:uncharacterized protein
LKKLGLVKTDLIQLKNSELFIYSPYKSLTSDQFEVADSLLKDLKSISGAIKVSGSPGTGKSILAIYLMKYIKDSVNFKNFEVALVVPMTSFRSTLKKVFKKVKNLSSSMVIGPNDVVKKDYDLLIVDEAHRLKKRKNLTNYGSFDQVNKELNLENGSQLDWITLNSKKQIFFYDSLQSIHPSDVDFSNISFVKEYKLTSQLRVKGGDEYISFIDNLLRGTPININFKEYDFEIFDDLKELVDKIYLKNEGEENKSKGLSRMLAGYAWEWISKNSKKSKNKEDIYDIVIDGVKLKWNSTSSAWASTKNAINEVGCIHTIQGYDLNYAGVIIGPELSYNFEKNELVINKKNYKDRNGKASVDDDELKKYILNIYRVLLTRGIFGTYIYICDKNLRKYFKSLIEEKNNYIYSLNDEKYKESALAEKQSKWKINKK